MDTPPNVSENKFPRKRLNSPASFVSLCGHVTMFFAQGVMCPQRKTNLFSSFSFSELWHADVVELAQLMDRIFLLRMREQDKREPELLMVMEPHHQL